MVTLQRYMGVRHGPEPLPPVLDIAIVAGVAVSDRPRKPCPDLPGEPRSTANLAPTTSATSMNFGYAGIVLGATIVGVDHRLALELVGGRSGPKTEVMPAHAQMLKSLPFLFLLIVFLPLTRAEIRAFADPVSSSCDPRASWIV